MSEQVMVGKRYAIVIPKSVRGKIGLREGQTVLVRAEGEKIVVEPLPEDPYAVLGEIVGEPYREDEDEEKAERWLKRHARR